MEATQLLASACDLVRLEILPASQGRLPARPQDTGTSPAGRRRVRSNKPGCTANKGDAGTRVQTEKSGGGRGEENRRAKTIKLLVVWLNFPF